MGHRRPGRRPRVSRPPLRRRRHRRRHDPTLAALALELWRLMDASLATEDPEEGDALVRAYQDVTRRLHRAMRARDLPAIEVRGRLFVDLIRCDDNGCVPELPEGLEVFSTREITRVV